MVFVPGIVKGASLLASKLKGSKKEEGPSGPENQAPPKYIYVSAGLKGPNSQLAKLRKINPAYTKFKADQKRRGDIKTRPVKIDKKGLTPARTLAKDESKIRKSDINRSKPGDAGNPTKRKEEYDPRKANRAGQRMGQRKAGGTVKKYAVGGSVDFSDHWDAKGNQQETVKERMLSEIANLKYLARNGTPTQKAEAKQYIKEKKAGIKAGEKLVQTKKSGRVYGRAIPTFEDAPGVEGLGMGQKDRMDKYMEDQKILKKEEKRIRKGNMKKGGAVKKMKHGGKVGKKKCPRDGIAMRGKTRAKRG